ncbi:MAG TPA: hypothetical protein VFU93_02725 [Acidimicrobiales bacterium]|nr:hypothetical protein [Acidimicrobiales bacterium]
MPVKGDGVTRFFRNPDTGQLVIAQRPNLPLAIFLVATAVRIVADPDGTAGDVVSVIGTVALGWWGVDEVVRGDSPFRRVLGCVVLGLLVLRLLTA